MYIPPCQSNIRERKRCHLIRGRALRQMEMATEALMDLTHALKLDPTDEQLEKETCALRRHIEHNGDGWKEEWETDLL